MAFKSVSAPKYDAGRDVLDQIPPALVGTGLAVLLAVLALGTFWFLKRHFAALRAEGDDAANP